MLIDRAKLINDYFAYFLSQADGEASGDFDIPEYWAIEELYEAAHDNPEFAWSIVLDLLEMAPSEKALGNLAAGPLEDLIEYHGPLFIDRIEAEARRNGAFRELLKGVWQSSTPDVWARIEQAQKES